ncbi:Aste57867_21649 [Aphanomyces stellatus]|uniref:Aste57867_21649 protein n=1 Tax=Aphanomyces stellatus TaxID=120398 RepID=A0A485LIS9_9STRA|nr:hypothetical protein As57867_021580 [Aphanomyces stellatus]VFT98318.1 Aste57867_21649 [Aphanomyces stellatus]
MDYLTCEECGVLQSKVDEFRESQWENPRPMCNTCATKRAWSMFAADIAACPNAHVIHNHGKQETPTPAVQVPVNARNVSKQPAQWEKEAAQKIKRQLEPDNVASSALVPSVDNPAASRVSKWCIGCEKAVRKAQRCSQCKRVFFCSAACQKACWPTHKAACFRVEAEDPSEAQAWAKALAATSSSDKNAAWNAFSDIQTWLASKESAPTDFRAADGISLFLQQLDDDAIDVDTKWQILLLLTRFVENSDAVAVDLHHLGGVSVLATLVADGTDFRIQAAAIVTLGSLLASNPTQLAPYYIETGAIDAALTVLLAASTLQDDVELVACVQSTALVLQLLEQDQEALARVVAFSVTPVGTNEAETDDDDAAVSIATLLVRLVGNIDVIYRLNQAAGVPVGHHLYLNVLTLVGAMVHAHPDCKAAFVDAGLLPLVCRTIASHCLPPPPPPPAPFWTWLYFWLVSWVRAVFLDWRVRLSPGESLDVLDRFVPILTPFLSHATWCDAVTTDHHGIALACGVLHHVLRSPLELAARTRLAALDLFVCMALPPFDMADDIRHVRVHAHLDHVLPALHATLVDALPPGRDDDAPSDDDSDKSPESTLRDMLLSEAVKCAGLVAHFGRSMPMGDVNIPSDLAHVVMHAAVPDAAKWTAVAALIQWDVNGNRVALRDDDDWRALRRAVDALFETTTTSPQQKDLRGPIDALVARGGGGGATTTTLET